MNDPLPVVLADADNTLWDTDAVFADAQLEILLAVDRSIGCGEPENPLVYVRQYDQALAQLDHRHLRYPPALLVKALALAGDPLTTARAVIGGQSSIMLGDQEVETIVAEYAKALNRIPQLLPGVVKGLGAARQAGIDVWILTEGAADRQRMRAQALGVIGLVKGVREVVKTRGQFTRQRRRFSPAPLFVIGDQPDRDIAPAQAAGCTGVFVPSRFRPFWLTASAWHEADYVADSFDIAIDWILASPERRPTAVEP